jgi:uracil-DNA glycosylase family 4
MRRGEPGRAVAAELGLTLWVRRKHMRSSALPAVPLESAGAEGSSASPVALPEPGDPMRHRGSDPAAEWEALEREVASCTRCALATGRTRTVFGVGDRHARWLLVGEGPGRDEDLQGEPFVGRAGRLLDCMLAALGLSRERVFIANVVKCRPPENRTPFDDECRACLPYLERQIALVRPSLVLALGRVAAQNILRTNAPLGSLRGRVLRYAGPVEAAVVVTYHPAYLLRQPSAKAEAWRDLRLAARSVAP